MEHFVRKIPQGRFGGVCTAAGRCQAGVCSANAAPVSSPAQLPSTAPLLGCRLSPAARAPAQLGAVSPSRGYHSSVAMWHPASMEASFLSSSPRASHGQRAGWCQGSLLICSGSLARRRRRRARSYPEAADAAVAVGKLSLQHLAAQSPDVRCL